ncbi:MAG TPA: YbhN family protein [Acidimicrobiia bacterium]|nr:YbhN family protein [Acidimicrobiia bacterium]
MFHDLPRLRSVFPLWFLPIFLFEAAAFVSMWELMRVALGTKAWFDVACAQLAGNALSRALPGGVATGGATQLGMLRRAGFDPTTTTTALTAVGLLSTATLFVLPLLAVPALLFGLAIDSRLVRGGIVAAIVAVFLLSGASALLLSDRVVRGFGRAIDWTVAKVRRRRVTAHFTTEILEARDFVRSSLADSWQRAVPAAFGNQLFDYGALTMSLFAVGARVDPAPVLLAFVVASVLAMIPLTPGGLGFVEAGLTGTLTLAGASAAHAVLATLLYRVFAYWVPLPAGALASTLFARRHGSSS